MTATHPLSFSKFPTSDEVKAAFPGLRALFFDMDGTLFDTEKYHIEAMLRIGKEFNIKAPLGPKEVHDLMVGRADHLVFEIIKYWENFPKNWTVADFVSSKNNHFLNIVRNVSGDSYFGTPLKTLINKAKQEQLKVALVTSSEKAVTQELLKISGLTEFFDLVLTRDDCPKHKPDPWPYVEALRFFDLTPKEALIFEDSGVGLMAALASGAHVVKVEWYENPTAVKS